MNLPVKNEIWEDVYLKTTCYGCPAATCGMIAHRVNGVVVKVDGDPDNPFSLGKLCAKGQAQIMMAYSRRRLTRPMKRTNPEKGIGVDPQWVEISYEEALSLTSEALKKCHEKDPTGLVFATSDFTTFPWMVASLLVSFGSFNHTSGGRAFCGNAVHPILQQVHGGFHIGPDFHHTNHVMLFGSNKGAMGNWAAVTAALDMSRARRRGMKLVVVDPWCSNAASIADEWVPIRPGTDGALVLAMVNLLINEFGLYDHKFLETFSNGPYLIKADGQYARDSATNKPRIWDTRLGRAVCFDDPELSSPAMEGEFEVDGQKCRPAFALLREHLKKYTPEYAAEITTIPAERIVRLAKDFGTAASIGSTIDIEGVTLPLRPACAHWYKGISQHSTGLEQGLAIALLNTVIGAIDVPGGISSDSVYAHHPKYSEFSTWMGKDSDMRMWDGLVAPGRISTYADNFPGPVKPQPVTEPATMAADSLMPLGVHASNFSSKINALDPSCFNNKVQHYTGVYVQVVSNDMLQEGNPKTQEEYLRKFEFQVSIVPNIDETAEFADVLIPTQTQLERLDMGANNIPDTMGSTGTGEYCINLRQPVVETPYKHFVDIWIDIIEKVGVLPNFYTTVNHFLELEGDYALKADRRYDYKQITEHWIQGMTGGDLTLEDVAKDSCIKWKKTVKERYARPFYKSRIPVYYEYFIDMGRQIKEVTERMGIKNWDVSRYVALLDWWPPTGFRQQSAGGFDLYGVSYKWGFLTGTFSNYNPWLAELSQNHPYVGKIVLNRRYADAHGIRSDDRVRVENNRGHTIEGVAMVSECIHPECVGMDHAGGNWSKSLPPRRKSTGVQFGRVLEYEMENLDILSGAIDASPKLRVTRID